MTWTNSIDPMKTICPRELRRRCSDKKCEFEHLRNFDESRTGQALVVVERLQSFFDETTLQAAEKDFVRAKIAIYSGKNVDDAVYSLVSSLCPSLPTTPLHTRSPNIIAPP